MVKKLLFILLLLPLFSSFAQMDRDSMDRIIFSIKSRKNDLTTTYDIATNLIDYANEIHDTLYIIKSQQAFADYLWAMALYGKAEDFYIKSAHFADSIKYPNEYAYALYGIGWIEAIQKNNFSKLYMLRNSLKIYENINDKMGVIQLSNALAGAYSEMAKKDPTKPQYRDSAIIYLFSAKKIIEETQDYIRGLDIILNNITDQYLQKKDYKEAQKYLNLTLLHIDTTSRKNNYYQTALLQSKILLSIGKVDSSLYFARKILLPIEKLGNKEYIRGIYSLLYKIYKEKKDFSLSLNYLEKHDSINKIIDNELLSIKYEEIETNLQLLKKEKEIESLQQQNELFQVKEKQKKIMLTGVIIITILIIIFLVIIIRRNRDINRLHTNVSAQKRLLEEKHKEITDSITYAKRIQEAILPSQRIITENLPNSFVLYQPKDIVAGDFYWLEKVNDSIYFAAADCTGHGVPGAMVSVVCANSLSKALLEDNITETGKILDRTRELVVEHFSKSEENVQDGMDISLCKLSGNTLQWSGANNPLWIIRKDSIKIEEIKSNKQAIGKTDKPLPFTSHNIELNQGDSIYIFTDGYADQFGGEYSKKFKSSQLKIQILAIQHMDLNIQKETLLQKFNEWKRENEQTDDVCIIGVKF
ncbi:MAG: serine/threonine-protein phosphatase [Brumimicrobium sp.]|nr:serine/threonine-protein phosphatase [Brumimicrobium sp.]